MLGTQRFYFALHPLNFCIYRIFVIVVLGEGGINLGQGEAFIALPNCFWCQSPDILLNNNLAHLHLRASNVGNTIFLADLA
jgi:hypothetical protein